MKPAIDLDQYVDQVADICERLGVRRLEAFGSALRPDFDPERSDLDFFYELEDDQDLFNRFLSLKRQLEGLFGRRVDLLREEQIQNPYIQRQVESSPRKQLYAA